MEFFGLVYPGAAVRATVWGRWMMAINAPEASDFAASRVVSLPVSSPK
jgi:hypothetical protein